MCDYLTLDIKPVSPVFMLYKGPMRKTDRGSNEDLPIATIRNHVKGSMNNMNLYDLEDNYWLR